MKRRSLLFLVILVACTPAWAAGNPKTNPDQSLDRVVANERALADTMRSYSPMVETYLQRMQPDTALGFVPSEDHYFLGRVPPKESNGCRECHVAVPMLHPHLQYASGMRTRCHDPHASKFPGLLRARLNDVCLDCHLLGRVKHPSRYLPTIELTADYRFGHPYARHPVNGSPDPISGGEISCIGCHQPHEGNKLHQLKMGDEIPEDALNQNTETKDLCEKCHMKLWGMDGAGAGKKGKKKIKAVVVTH
jgi:predicted CXXCH cytochrome family protein